MVLRAEFEAGLAVPACLFVGVAHAVGSRLIRDVLVREEPLLLKPGQFYVIASLAGVVSFAMRVRWFQLGPVLAAFSAIAVTFGLRFRAIFFDWKTRPVLRPPSIS